MIENKQKMMMHGDRKGRDAMMTRRQVHPSILTPCLSGKQSSLVWHAFVNAEDKQFAICMLKMGNGTQSETVLAKCGVTVCC